MFSKFVLDLAMEVSMKRELLMILLLAAYSLAQELNLPSRPADAPSGSEFAEQVWNYTLEDREAAIYAQIMAGNIPDFQRVLVPLTFTESIGESTYEVLYYVLPDYLAVGADSNYFLIPMTPILAQRICNALNLTMPTRKMVNQIWSAAAVKLSPQPIPPSPEMTTIPIMWQHNEIVWGQREPLLSEHPLGELVGGNKKDLVISNKIYGNPPPGRVVIYGWHYTDGTPIQPLYSGHSEDYADYSHGIRLVQDSIIVNGQPAEITGLLQNDSLYVLFSDEGRIPIPYYPIGAAETVPPSAWGILNNGLASVRFIISEQTDVTHYLVHISSDGITFPESLLLDKNNPVLNDLETDLLYYFRLQAVGSDTSIFTEVLAAMPTESSRKALIVNGFDRSYSGNTRDFVRMHAAAIKQYGFPIESVTNEAISYGLVALSDYEIVDWILGVESTADETFSNSEQDYVETFLDGGGKLFVSGSEIAWDLDYKGSSADKAFFANYLKAKYIADAPNNQANTHYKAVGIEGLLFENAATIDFDNGTHGSYNVSYPDVLSGVNGGVPCLHYYNLSSSGAGIAYRGSFPQGETVGALVYLGFPFEAIYPESKRFEIMENVLDFFEDPTALPEKALLPQQFRLEQNFPNPFNPQTIIRWQSPWPGNTTLIIYDARGKLVMRQASGFRQPGLYELFLNLGNFSSGVYFYQIQVGDFLSESKKMIRLK
ncbi:MAG TPA: T9SS type A sorting domain-containing protein [Candidatus Marinimicrobia bacterium]|nr:T9SS type A sorting domain-containing protein [Candidatus Neomarinimicrobiota bacterium]